MDTETYVMVVKITDDNRDDLVKLALAMYLGEQCKYCGRTYETLDDLHDTVWAGLHEHGRLACAACWQANNPALSNNGVQPTAELVGREGITAESENVRQPAAADA